MNETIDDKISQFTSSTILKMHSEGWFNSELRNFDLVVLNSLTDLQHINLDELPLNQLQYIVERAAQSFARFYLSSFSRWRVFTRCNIRFLYPGSFRSYLPS